MTVLDLPRNRWARVEAVEGDDAIRTRLLEMGFTPGECIRLVAASPFHNPIAVNLRGTVFALRDYEASCLKVCLMD
ncbi:MAG: hypothetical protein A3G34_08105 [Candidatus Lindowbacteria bacterium RIFCSPLOWO2_12_FULL_62_27]|nr:MAG: hypothetical protein A3G34_08105 [Candidatus Lindowbacteria bacterium RIFCSPLOWO2_12_FULL_62_27]OGH62342.1 MAG: hypothetical protein A3I06_00320 [Candidatus Lindowbacteria bacterium RIFCSPLOWO2_02_FULL_62_12]